jgi:hypothetical protein
VRERALTHVKAIARPRAAGSIEEDDARRWCRDRLTESGFSITEEPFAFSAAVGSWAAPLAGALSFVALTIGAWVVAEGGNVRALGAWTLVFATLVAAAGVWSARTGVLSFPLLRRESVNLIATRGVPDLWLVAHLDTKSQPIPSLVRAGSLIVMGIALAVQSIGGLTGLAVVAPELVLAGILPGAVAASVVSLAGVGNESPGARDNATGIVTVLLAAAALPRERSLGVLLTSAEELGLAGARAWCRSRPPGVAINVDTIDDDGAVRCMTHGRSSRALAGELARASEGGIVVQPLIPGILTDGVAMADAGWQVVTLSRGSLGTLGRIHRPSDDVRDLTGAGIAHVTSLLVGFLSQEHRAHDAA